MKKIINLIKALLSKISIAEKSVEFNVKDELTKVKGKITPKKK
jgi:hypothetical protein